MVLGLMLPKSRSRSEARNVRTSLDFAEADRPIRSVCLLVSSKVSSWIEVAADIALLAVVVKELMRIEIFLGFVGPLTTFQIARETPSMRSFVCGQLGFRRVALSTLTARIPSMVYGDPATHRRRSRMHCCDVSIDAVAP